MHEESPAFTLTGIASLSLLLALGSGLFFFSLLLEGRLGILTSVEREIVAGNVTDRLDVTRLDEVPEEGPADRSINLELFHDSRASDAENLGHLGADFVEALLVKENFVVELVLNLGLGPGLLLGLGTLGLLSLSALGGGRSLIFG